MTPCLTAIPGGKFGPGQLSIKRKNSTVSIDERAVIAQAFIPSCAELAGKVEFSVPGETCEGTLFPAIRARVCSITPRSNSYWDWMSG
jgi:hypothetical protein